MDILTENTDLIAVVKPPELVSEQVGDGSGLGDMLCERNGGYIGVIHRMDRGVGGVTVYAKHPDAAAFLSRAVQEHRMEKEYLAITEGIPAGQEGELQDLLFYDRMKNKVFPVRRMRGGVKKAMLLYRILATGIHPESGKPLALLSVCPVTGRTHQIRVQFASRKMPLLGDRKYGGSGNTGISLWCRRIRIPAYRNNPAQTVVLEPHGVPWDWLMTDCAESGRPDTDSQ